MRLIDADALRIDLWDLPDPAPVVAILDAAPSINCAVHNPFRLVPSKCPMCGEGMVPYPCMDMAQDSYRDGILYGQQHPEP